MLNWDGVVKCDCAQVVLGDVKLYPVWLREALALLLCAQVALTFPNGITRSAQISGMCDKVFGPEPSVECSMMLATVSVGILESSVNTHQLSLTLISFLGSCTQPTVYARP